MSSTVITKLLGKNELDREMLLDSVSKLRVSTPESLIDTDFEYGLQAIKWETLQLVNNLPTFFSRTGDAVIPVSDVSTIAGVQYVTVTTTAPHGLIDGQPFLIQGLRTAFAEGYFTVNKVINTTTFVYRAAYVQLATRSVSDPNTTALYPGQYYQSTGLTQNQFQYVHTDSNDPSRLNVNTFHPHGFSNGTYFTLTNSVGKRVVNFSGAFTGSNFTANGHNLIDSSLVTYNPNGNAVLSGLTSNANYYVFATTSNVFRISANPTLTPAISIGTAGTGTHQFITNDDATDGSFYKIVDVPSQCNFLLQAPFQILPNVITFDPTKTVDLQSSILQFSTLHKAQTGAIVVYNAGAGGTACAGLTSGSTYYVIRRDLNSIQLASSYANAIAGTAINMQSGTIGTGTAHTLTFHSIDGEVLGTGTVTFSNNSNIIWGSNLNFLSMIRPDEKLFIEIPATSNVYTLTSTATSSNFTTSANIASNTTVKLLGAVGGLTVNNYYYVRNTGTNACTLHDTRANANGGLSAITATTTASVSITTIPYGNVIEPKVLDVWGSSRVSVTSNITQSTSTNLRVLNHTGVYPFMDGLVLHRAIDGGIELVPSNNCDAQVIRQTRRYFRYQPGKGIQCSLSINFNAPIDVDYAVYNAGTGKVTVTTKKPHRMTSGLQITMDNQIQAYKNSTWTGIYTVTVTNITSFEYSPGVALNPTVCPGLPIFWVNQWSNSRIRAGMFDDQNGMFFEFDGSTMYAVRRDSVTQISGYCSVTYGSPIVTGVENNRFLTQITNKSMVVIKGMSYKVVFVENDSTFYIQPPYRGVSDTFCVVSLTTDTRTPQSQWNLDKCDGTGPSGYDLDPRRIQMIYYDYSWYGAGKIRYGFKDTSGEVRYVHQYIHNNQFTTAYFRAGNLPARYEIMNVGQPTWTPPLLHWGTSVIMDGRYDDDKAYLFTASGNVLNFANGDTIAVSCTIPSPHAQLTTIYDPDSRRNVSAYRIVTAGLSSNSSRYQDVQNIRPGTRVVGTSLPNDTFTIGTPQRDNTDPNKALIFINKAPTAAVTVATNYTFGDVTDLIPSIIPLVSIRLAPSVDTSIGGVLGVREILNRMQLRLRSVGLMTTNDSEIQLILNGINTNKNWIPATSPSLSQLVYHNKNDSIEGGTIIFSYRVPGGVFDSSGKRTSEVESYDISQLGSLGNAIMGGNGVYPDGTDVLTIAVVCLEAGGVNATTPFTLTGRITWAENQS